MSWRELVVGTEVAVPLAGGGQRPYVNLDNAASTPVLREVLDAIVDFMPWYSSVHRGAGYKSRIATQAFEDARETVARFVGADPAGHTVVFGKNCTEAINKLAHRLPLAPDDVVLVSLMEHHSNDLPWRARARVRHIGVDAQGALDEAHLRELLDEHAGRVKLVAVSGGSNVTGHVPDVHRIAALAHAAGAQILVDAAQLAPHRPIRMGRLDDPAHLDYLALSAHKLYTPFGTGALIARRDALERGEPEYRGGGTIRVVTTDSVAWADAPERDEAGTPNVVGAVALAVAVRVLQRVGLDAIARHESTLTARALERLAQVPGLRVYGDADPARAAGRLGVVPFALEGRTHAEVARALSVEHGIGVRSGCFCAHPYLIRLLGLDAAQVHAARATLLDGDAEAAPGLVRASFGLYNTEDEVDVLVAALRSIAVCRLHHFMRSTAGGVPSAS